MPRELMAVSSVTCVRAPQAPRAQLLTEVAHQSVPGSYANVDGLFLRPRYGYFGRECTDRLVPLGVILLAISAVQSSPFAVGLNLPHR